ncbi:MAG: S49 family peptidase, partial [Pseudomonadota bacterium]
RRGAKLATDRDLFTGEIWAGAEAVELGLIDGLGHLVPEMKRRFGEKTRFRVEAPRRGLFGRLGVPGARDVAAEMLGAVEEHALWSRHGAAG